MSELTIKTEIRRFIRTSGLEANPKMVCSIVKLFKMKYGSVDRNYIAQIATKLINEY